MGCERWREILSAQLDGEETREQGAAVRQHLVACPNCRRWHDRAAEITRRARTRLGASPFELTEVVLGSAPAALRRGEDGPARRRVVAVLRVGADGAQDVGAPATGSAYAAGDRESGLGGAGWEQRGA